MRSIVELCVAHDAVRRGGDKPVSTGTRADRETVTRFLAAFVLASCLLLGISVLVYRSASQHRDAMVRDAETHAVQMRQRAISAFLHATMSDLELFVDLNGIRDFEAASSGWRDTLLQESLAFLLERGSYDQVAVADASGAEVVHVGRDATGVPASVPPDVITAGDLARQQPVAAEGSVTFIPFALATRNGQPESPPKPVIGVGIGLWQNGRYVGAVYFDVLAAALLREFDQAHPESDSDSMLVDAPGYWMRGGSPDAEWGDLISGRRGAAFSYAFPDEWRRVAASDQGQFETADGLFTYVSIRPLAELTAADTDDPSEPVAPGVSAPTSDPTAWRIVSHVPVTTLLEARYVGLTGLILADALGVLALALGSWILMERTTRARQFRTHVVAENAALSSTLGRYLPKLVSARLRGNPPHLAGLGGESRFVAVLFADIRGFTRFSESRSPHDVVATLNRALAEITAPLLRHNGILDKYTGDGLLAFFEPFGSQEAAARNAVAAAREMQSAFKALQRDSADPALAELGLGVGINAGRVIVGNIGSEEFMDYTVIGDAVNVAARLQAMAEAGQILVTDTIYDLTRGQLSVESVSPLSLRGRQEQVRVYRLSCDT